MPALPEIHYLWVGPPTKDNVNSLPGHDIAGPIRLCKEFQKDIYDDKEKNNIKFWCLKEYCDDYRKLFMSQGVQIEVCAIEEFLEKQNHDDDTCVLAENLKKISLAISLAEKINVGDLIDFKDRFSLYLLTKQPGYFLDTNVFPKVYDGVPEVYDLELMSALPENNVQKAEKGKIYLDQDGT